MSYSVKEMYYSLQGEGINVGRPAVFCRFAGCNLWSGREQNREHAICKFCDTDFVGVDGPGGGRFGSAEELVWAAAAQWPDVPGKPFIVLTGGEPLLQADEELLKALRGAGFEVAVETNGTQPVPEGIDWLTVSPKAGTILGVRGGDELKLVYPQKGAEPHRFEKLEFKHWLLQPMDGPDREANTRAAIEYCKSHPRWRLSLQTHKILGIR